MGTTQQLPGDLEFSRHELDRLVAETIVERVEYLPHTSSTNSWALDLAAAEPSLATCTLVLADRQTAGRGRGANPWWSAEGALTFSLLLKPDRLRLMSQRWPQVSLSTGLAVCDAIDSLLGRESARLKWPNDVYLAGRKACGILVEGTDGSVRNLVIGVGVNVNNSATAAPPDLREIAIALCDVADRPISRIDLLVAILQRLAAQLEQLASRDDGLRDQWTRRCLLTGRRVEIELPRGRLTGTCRGIDADGMLLVENERGTERCVSGIVARFE